MIGQRSHVQVVPTAAADGDPEGATLQDLIAQMHAARDKLDAVITRLERRGSSALVNTPSD